MDILDKAYLGNSEDLQDASVAIGVFDGCHLGHAALIGACVRDALDNGRKSAIVTFDIDPDELFSRDVKKIMSNEQRLSCLADYGVDAILPINFNKETASVSALDFLGMLFGQKRPASIHVGSDFRFGKNHAGDIETLSAWCKENGVELVVHDLVEKDGGYVKSTRIRQLLEEGDIAEANALLGHPYIVCGTVKHGRGEGASFGIATANVDAACLLCDGVYAGYAKIDATSYKAAINVGVPPTFEDRATDALEVHVLDYSGDLYGKQLCVSFIERLRPLVKFDSTEDLIAQITSDINYVKNYL